MSKTLVLIGIIVGIVVLGISISYAVCINACQSTNQGMMGAMMGSGIMSGMMSGKSNSGMNFNSMMSDIPQDVIIKVKSSQTVSVGKEQSLTLLVLDKETKKPLTDAQVIVGIERGAPMSTMSMLGPMFNAENMGNGKYVAKFTLDTPGYYTLHTHVIPAGKSMHAMMYNHEDIGIIGR